MELLLCSLLESYDLIFNALETGPEAGPILQRVGKLMDGYNFRKELQAGEDTEKTETALKLDDKACNRNLGVLLLQKG